MEKEEEEEEKYEGKTKYIFEKMMIGTEYSSMTFKKMVTVDYPGRNILVFEVNCRGL